MRPLRVATLHSHKDRSFLVRCQEPIAWLQKQGAVEWLAPMKAWEADVVLLHRQWQPGALAVIRSLQRNGIRVVADVDDDSWESHPQARQVLQTVDAVSVANSSLAASLSAINSNLTVNPSGIDVALWRKLSTRRPGDRVRTVSFVATTTHGEDLEILRPVLAKLSHKFREQEVRFVCFGFRPAWLPGVMAGSEVVEPCRPEDYPTRLVKLGLDLALAPLASVDSARSKTALTISEYAMGGAVSIATNAEPYANSSALLVDNKPESWIQAVFQASAGPRPAAANARSRATIGREA